MDQLLGRREPLALILLVAAGLRLLIGVVAIPVLAGDGGYGSVATAALFEAGRTFDVVLVVATAAAAIWCAATPAVPRAVPIVIAAAIETGLAVLLSLGFGLMGLLTRTVGRGIEFGYVLLGLVVPALAVTGLLLTLRSLQAAQAVLSRADAEAQMATAAGTAMETEPTVVVGPGQPPAQPPTWGADEASGRVWHTAGDAARGEPGAGWPTGGAAGWQPIPGSTEQPQPERPTS